MKSAFSLHSCITNNLLNVEQVEHYLKILICVTNHYLLNVFEKYLH